MRKPAVFGCVRSIALAVGLAGCTAITPPQVVRISTQAAMGPLPDILDVRAATARVYREESSGSVTRQFLADETLQPSILELLKQRLADSLPAHLRSARIELRQAEVGVVVTLWGSPPSTTPSYTPAGPAGAIILGTLLGHGLIHGIRLAKSSTAAFADITIAINDETILGYGREVLSDRSAADEGVRRMVLRALDDITAKVAALAPPAESQAVTTGQ